MGAPSDRAPWVLVAGGFHHRGAMDRANAALAQFLLNEGRSVHLVGHEIDPSLGHHPRVTTHRVRRPRGFPALAEHRLGRTGTAVARAVLRRSPAARVVVNGGNCAWDDVNWVHAVHAAWPVCDDGVPWWSRYRARRLKARARRRERAALRRARVIIANSHATARALTRIVGVAAEGVRTVYLGSDPAWGPATAAERHAARQRFSLPPDPPVVAFVGTLGADLNKGYDVLWEAWRAVHARGLWDAHLLVAGSGWRLPQWRREAARCAAGASVHFLGFTTEIREVLAASDILVSPVRYEAYGLNVHEALCRGLAVMVTETAGVTETFLPGMHEALLPSPVTAGGVAERLAAWRRDVDGWRARAAATGARIRARTWVDMAAEFVGTVECVPAGARG
jgi:glycosyltransferase involved in cell wall biosynthesis